jgi:hypothetical protein
MDEYIRADNNFQQTREEAYRYSEMTRGFRGRLHPRHVRMIHNPCQSKDRGNHNQGHKYSSQSTRTQQSSFQTASPMRQRRAKLLRKIQLTTKKVVLLVMWRRYGAHK